jgi:uncharacterized protein
MHALPAPPLEAAREMKFTALSLKEVGLDGVFEGYASLFDRQDLGRDVVAPGAFRDSLAKRGAAGIRMLFQHDANQPIGVWTRLYEDARGLYARGRLTTDVAKAREVLALMRAGAIDGLSIGFRAVKGVRSAKTGVRRLDQVDLWEISIVTFPMLPEARVTSVKAQPLAGRPQTKREFARCLTQDAGFTRSEGRALVRSGPTGLPPPPDAERRPGWEARLRAHLAEAAHLLRQCLNTNR